MVEDQKTWPSWVDVLGNTIVPGDTIAVATINGRSPQMVIARVERINRVNSRGEEIVSSKNHWEDGKCIRSSSPSCTITATPLIDARGFFRWSTRKWSNDAAKYVDTEGPAKKITYQIPENCIKVTIHE